MTVRIDWKRNALYDIRRSRGVQAELMKEGKRIQVRANATLREKTGYGLGSRQGERHPQGRWRVTVFTRSTHAKRSNAIHQTLVRVLD